MTRFTLSSRLSTLALAGLGGACLVAACSSSSDSHSAAIPSGGSSSSDGGGGGTRRVPTGTGGGSGGTTDDASAGAGQAGQGVTVGDGGAAGEQQGTVVQITPGACSETPAWTGAAPLDVVSTAADEALLSITADELDIVFLRDGALYLAHRTAPSADFAVATAVTLPAGYVADAGAALSSDGTTLVLVSADGQSFGALTRALRTDDFGATADTSAFLGLNARSSQTLEHYAAPVLAPDGQSFVFSGFTPGPDGTAVVYESLLSAGQWAMPNNLSKDKFDGSGGKRPLPSGLSSDSRTLFYFDEAAGKELARFRDRPDAPLYTTVDLGDLQGAVPNSKCDRIYYSSAGNVLTESE